MDELKGKLVVHTLSLRETIATKRNNPLWQQIPKYGEYNSLPPPPLPNALPCAMRRC